MNTSQHILFLYPGNDEPAIVKQLADSIRHLGSTAVSRTMCDRQYDKILDAVAIADTVIYWSPG